MYFQKFPRIVYEYDIKGKGVLKTVVDITRNVRFQKELLSNITLYDLYDIKDGETPEMLSDRIYGSSQYHWVIMLANDRYDYIRDWPMSSDVLNNYILSNYTTEQLGDTHHWEKDGYIVESDILDASPVSNWEHEVRQNDLKRRIKIINPVLLKQILQEFNNLTV